MAELLTAHEREIVLLKQQEAQLASGVLCTHTRGTSTGGKWVDTTADWLAEVRGRIEAMEEIRKRYLPVIKNFAEVA